MELKPQNAQIPVCSLPTCRGKGVLPAAVKGVTLGQRGQLLNALNAFLIFTNVDSSKLCSHKRSIHMHWFIALYHRPACYLLNQSKRTVF